MKWERFRSKLTPGEKETWTAIVTGPDAKPHVAEMVAALYDASLDQFTPHPWPVAFGVFRREFPRGNSTLQNIIVNFRDVTHWDGPESREPNWHYRTFPAEITGQTWEWRFRGLAPDSDSVMAALAAPAIGLGAATPQPGTAAKTATFVLVHGAWHGGWCWQRVNDRLTARGHRVFAPTLTGVGERSHLDSPSVDLSTQIRDVVNEIRWKDLENVVLVGHSYGGMVISGVAEQVAPKIASIVYQKQPTLN